MVKPGRSSFTVTSHMVKLQEPCNLRALGEAVDLRAQHHHQTFAQQHCSKKCGLESCKSKRQPKHLGRACPSSPATPSPDVHHSLKGAPLQPRGKLGKTRQPSALAESSHPGWTSPS